MSVFATSRGPWGSSLAAWEASGGVRRGPGRPQKATVLLEDSMGTRVKISKSYYNYQPSLVTALMSTQSHGQ